MDYNVHLILFIKVISIILHKKAKVQVFVYQIYQSKNNENI